MHRLSERLHVFCFVFLCPALAACGSGDSAGASDTSEGTPTGSGGTIATTGAATANGGATSSSGATAATTGGGGTSGGSATSSSGTGGAAGAGGSSGAGAGGGMTAGPTVIRSFDGDTGEAGSKCGGAPGCLYKDHPDMTIAANGAQVVEVTGQYVTVFDYNGVQLKKTATATFVTNAVGVAAGTVNDPRIVYDPLISRWILGCSCSKDYLMVSASSDATGVWKGVELGLGSGDLTMYPGWDKNGVYVSEYGGSTTNYTVIALPAADVAWTGSGNVSLSHKNVFPSFPFEARPALDPTPNKAATAPAYFLARSGPIQNATDVAFNVLVDSLTWSGTTATKGAEHVIPSGYVYNTAITVPQPSGVGLRGTESHRFFSAVVSGNHLHGVVGSGPKQGVDTQQLFFWFDVDTSSMTIAESAKVSSASVGYLFPSLAVDASGNVGIVATASGSGTDPSVVLFAHHTTDQSGQLTGPITAMAGTQAYNCNSGTNAVGWGTYGSSAQDPTDPTKLWAVEEYGGSATPCQWHTRLVQYQP